MPKKEYTNFKDLLAGVEEELADSLDKEVAENGLEHIGVGLGPDLLDQLVPAGILVVDDVVKGFPLLGQGVAGKFIDQIHDLAHVVHGILVQIIKDLTQAVTCQTVRNFHLSVPLSRHNYT